MRFDMIIILSLLDCLLKLVQILFYITTAIIGILSFCMAKRTIFQPVKNIVFKKQIKTFEDFDNLFWNLENNKSSILEFIQYKDIFEINCLAIISLNLNRDIYTHPCYKQKSHKGFLAIEQNSFMRLMLLDLYITLFPQV